MFLTDQCLNHWRLSLWVELACSVKCSAPARQGWSQPSLPSKLPGLRWELSIFLSLLFRFHFKGVWNIHSDFFGNKHLKRIKGKSINNTHRLCFQLWHCWKWNPLGHLRGFLRINTFFLPFRIFLLKHLKAEKAEKGFLCFKRHTRFPIQCLTWIRKFRFSLMFFSGSNLMS